MHSVLGSVTLGYESLWNQWRQRAGVRLVVEPESNTAIDAGHLLAALTEFWSAQQGVLLLRVNNPVLLADLLDHAPSNSCWLEVHDAALSDALLAGRARKAHQRGVHLLWSGAPGQVAPPQVLQHFHKAQRNLTPHEALTALRVSLRQLQAGGSAAAGGVSSPIVPGHLYDGLASQALVEHALDRQGAWAVAGWPTEEMLHDYRFRQIQPARSALRALVQAIDADESLEALEHRMGDEPLLTYRFLRYANSAGLGLRHEINNVREGLMAMGYTRLRHWLLEQLPHACTDPNLDPIRASMVMRARIMEGMTDAGVEDDLRREVFLCGIFSQVDLLLGEPLGAALHRLPLPGRVSSAILAQTGPYAAWLDVACALESHSTRVIHDVCQAHHIPADEVNRALLRALTRH